MNTIKRIVLLVLLPILIMITTSSYNRNGEEIDYKNVLSQIDSRTDTKSPPLSKMYFSVNLSSLSPSNSIEDDLFSFDYDVANEEYSVTHIDDKPTSHTNIYSKDYFAEDSTGYDLLSDEDIILTYSGEHSPLLSKVTYTNYTISPYKHPKPEWIDYFKEAIYREIGEFDSPVIIKESWSISLDNMTLDIVTCCNIVYDSNTTPIISDYDGMKKAEQIPYGNCALYNSTAVFYNDNIINSSTFAELVTTRPISENINVSFAMPDKNYFIERIIDTNCSTYQFDNNKQIIESPIFTLSNHFDYAMIEWKYIFLDLNNDKILDIISHKYGNGINCLTKIESFENNSLIYKCAFN